MATYVILGVSDIRDAQRMARYNAAGALVRAKYKFKFLAGPTSHVQLEGAVPFERFVLLEFADRQAAEAWYYSDDYQAARSIRAEIADTFAVMIDSAPENR